MRATPRHALRKPRKYRRPEKFFRKGDVATCPEEVELVVTVPPCFEHEGTEAFIKRFEEAVKSRVEELHAVAAAKGLSYLGMRKVRAQRRKDNPHTTCPAAAASPPSPAATPSSASRSWPSSSSSTGVRWLYGSAHPAATRRGGSSQSWHRDYRAARTAWLTGQPRVVFPRGTYLMRAYPNVVLARPFDPARAAA